MTTIVAVLTVETRLACRQAQAEAQMARAAARATRERARRNRLRSIQLRAAARRSLDQWRGPIYAMSEWDPSPQAGSPSDEAADEGSVPVAATLEKLFSRAGLLGVWRRTADPAVRQAIEVALYGAPDGKRAREEAERLAPLDGGWTSPS